MNRSKRILLVSIFFTAAIILVAVASEEGKAEPIIVDDDGGPHADFTSIQEAVNESSDGDTILVFNGSYHENLLLNKTITLIGNGSANTTIKGIYNGTDEETIHVSADWVNITGFTITSESIYPTPLVKLTSNNNNLTKNNFSMPITNYTKKYAIRLQSSSSNSITDNVFSHNILYSLYLASSSNRNVLCNNIGNTIRLHKSHENYLSDNAGVIDLGSSNDNVIENNKELRRLSFSGSTNNTLHNNIVDSIGTGFSLEGSLPENYNHNIDETNLVNGKRLYYYLNSENIILTESFDGGFVVFVNCQNITVRNLNLSNNSKGLILINSSNINVINNTFMGNVNGIFMLDCSNSVIEANNLFDNKESGLTLISKEKSSLFNEIVNNSILRNRLGLYLEGSSPTIVDCPVIAYNYIANNQRGIDLYTTYHGIKNAKIIHNTFYLNDLGVRNRGRENTISNNTFHFNNRGVSVDSFTELITISYNNFSSNEEYGIYASIDISAEKNFWGHWTGPHNPSFNPEGEGDWISDQVVIFRPWLPEPWPPRKDLRVLEIKTVHNYQLPNHITVSLFNSGPDNATTVTVNVLVDGELLATEAVDIPAGQMATLRVAWSPERPGLKEITVVLDPENRFLEFNESDNTVRAKVTIIGKYFFDSSPETNTGVISPSQSTTFSLNITNIGWANDSYFLETSCPTDWQAELDESFVSVISNGTKELGITVLASPGALAGEEMRVIVTVRSAGNISFSRSINFTVLVRQTFDFESWTEHQGDMVPGGGATVNLSVSNLGNANGNFSFLLTSLPTGWQTSNTAVERSIPPFSLEVGKFVVTPSPEARAGKYQLTFLVEVEGCEPQEHVIQLELLVEYSINHTGKTAKGGVPGELVEYLITLTNTGNTDDVVFVLPEGCGVSWTMLPFAWGGSDILTATVKVPDYGLPHETINSSLTLVYGDGKQVLVPLTTTLLEHREMNVTAASVVNVELSFTKTVEILLFNTGNMPWSPTLDYTAPQGILLKFSSSEGIIIPAFSQETVRLNITVQDEKEYAGKSLGVTLLVEGLSPCLITIETGEFHEIIFEGWAFQNYEGGRSWYMVNVKNNGTAEEAVILGVSSFPGLEAALSSTGLILFPGSSTELLVSLERPSTTPGLRAFELVLSGQYGSGAQYEVIKNILVENIAPHAGFTVTPVDEGLWFHAVGSQDQDGTIVRYVWSSHRDGELYNSTESGFEALDLSSGTHNISLKVQDNYGVWSEVTFTTVVVKEEQDDAFSPMVTILGCLALVLVIMLLTVHYWVPLFNREK